MECHVLTQVGQIFDLTFEDPIHVLDRVDVVTFVALLHILSFRVNDRFVDRTGEHAVDSAVLGGSVGMNESGFRVDVFQSDGHRSRLLFPSVWKNCPSFVSRQ